MAQKLFLDYRELRSAHSKRKKPLSLFYLGKKLQILGWLSPKYGGKLAYDMWSSAPKVKQPDAAKAMIDQAKVEILSWQSKELYAYQWGNGQKTALLMHGWQGFAGQFHMYIPLLVEQGYTVYAIDAPQHGASGGDRSSLLCFSKALQLFLQHKQIEDIDFAIAHSGGCFSMLHAFDTLHIHVKALVIMSPFYNFCETIVRKYYAKLLNLSKPVLDALETRMEAAYGEDVWEITRMGSYMSSYENTKSIIVHDEDDKEIPIEDSISLKGHLPHAHFIHTAGLGHRRILRHAGLAKEIIKQAL